MRNSSSIGASDPAPPRPVRGAMHDSLDAAIPLSTERYRVCMSDVDAAGVLYYASPLLWHERLMQEWLVSLGHPLQSLLDAAEVPPCVSVACQFHSPVSLGTVLDNQLWADDLTRRSFAIHTTCGADGVLRAVVTSRHVWTRREGGRLRAQPVPEWMRASWRNI